MTIFTVIVSGRSVILRRSFGEGCLIRTSNLAQSLRQEQTGWHRIRTTSAARSASPPGTRTSPSRRNGRTTPRPGCSTSRRYQTSRSSPVSQMTSFRSTRRHWQERTSTTSTCVRPQRTSRSSRCSGNSSTRPWTAYGSSRSSELSSPGCMRSSTPTSWAISTRTLSRSVTACKTSTSDRYLSDPDFHTLSTVSLEATSVAFAEFSEHSSEHRAGHSVLEQMLGVHMELPQADPDTRIKFREHFLVSSRHHG
ncbi:hypothetical protein C8Q80DRAFT_1143397 [Daedaleopsis nitida]|nr:hypothetical protein C8Q80DRAFT_1143397 [Daedaleopsis nitida]